MDEVFEAFISARNVEPSELGFEDDFISREEVVDQIWFANPSFELILIACYLCRLRGARRVRDKASGW